MTLAHKHLKGIQGNQAFFPKALSSFCVKAWWGLSRRILALNRDTLEGLPPPPLSAVQALLRLSLSKSDNGWTRTGSGSVQRGLTEGILSHLIDVRFGLQLETSLLANSQ
ncbi:hypothetical protein MC885_000509 [Smutsia gigantea]|nr:hypothetical protein MC885_000509 [Smutsia gigantea]